ncbi:hypothetical protein VTK26DRAFT_691 [Humicola hyalothermophila]
MGFSKKAPNHHAADSAPASASTPGEQPSPSGVSFFSRFSLPLRSRARHITDFHIRPAEPHRKYGAGDHVQGAVILTVIKPVRITHLVVSLHGYMRVYKGPNVPADEPIVDPGEAPTTTSRSSRQKAIGNGYVRLFRDEQPLSGDGRLEPGRYEFNFNLLFPPDGLPSSVDFERGTISYVITATLTRPTSIGAKTPAKTSCERKIHLVERLDVGSVNPPLPRTIYLEPISKRLKKKKASCTGVEKSPVAAEAPPAWVADSETARPNENSTEGSVSVTGEDQERDAAGNNPPNQQQSDVRSISGESAASGSTGGSRRGDTSHSLMTAGSLRGKKIPAVKGPTITATVELLKGGCLAGDVVPVKVSVQHIRRIKSIHGVIVTLYRLGRIDSSPALLSKELAEGDARRSGKDEYYPRSKTGLGGLSLSAAGSCSMFRKDLSQAFAPLIIDPDTLTANITTSVRVPTAVFPTIQGVPYEMISFKYHVEVIVDLGGKLANQIQTNKLSSPRVGGAAGPLGMTGRPYDGDVTSLTSWGTSIIDTDRLRRQKGVICVVFEVIVGTADTSRVRGKGPMKSSTSIQTVPFPQSESYDGSKGETHHWPGSPNNEGCASGEHPQEYTPSPQANTPQPYPYWDSPPSQPSPSAPHYIPPPEIPDENTLSEKERVRRAEQRLLPSQPPDPPVAGLSTIQPADIENIYDADDQIPNPGPSHVSEPHAANAPIASEDPSAPTLEELSAAAENSAVSHDPTEDKQELERRRLLAEASAPPVYPVEDDDNDHDHDHHPPGVSGATAPPPASLPPPPPPLLPPSAPPIEDLEGEPGPSAPVLDEVDDEVLYGPNYSYRAAAVAGPPSSLSSTALGGPAEPLPKYER